MGDSKATKSPLISITPALQPRKIMKVQCPTCKNWVKWDKAPFRPFCSELCKNRDLGNWATEQYRVPAEEETPTDETPAKTNEE